MDLLWVLEFRRDPRVAVPDGQRTAGQRALLRGICQARRLPLDRADNLREVPLMRPSTRAVDEMRSVSFERGVARYAEGSCLVRFGDTHVLCAASLEDKPPPWLRGQGRGWVTAEYAMLPRATL